MLSRNFALVLRRARTSHARVRKNEKINETSQLKCENEFCSFALHEPKTRSKRRRHFSPEFGPRHSSQNRR